MTEHLGSWVRRINPVTMAGTTRWHLIESEIEDREVSRCGRQLQAKASEPFEYALTEIADACLRCRPNQQ